MSEVTDAPIPEDLKELDISIKEGKVKLMFKNGQFWQEAPTEVLPSLLAWIARLEAEKHEAENTLIKIALLNPKEYDNAMSIAMAALNWTDTKPTAAKQGEE